MPAKPAISKAPAKSAASKKAKTTPTVATKGTKRKSPDSEEDLEEEPAKRVKPATSKTPAKPAALKKAKTTPPAASKNTKGKSSDIDNEMEEVPVKRANAKKPITKKAVEQTKIPAPAPEKAAAPKKTAAPRKAAAPKPKKQLPEINVAPTATLHVFVFGEGSQGELGLGHKNAPGRKVIDVKRPRLNAILEELDIVQIAVGGMHCAALTASNQIYTWGVNDQGALGRHTVQEGKMETIDQDASDSDSDSGDEFQEDSGLNPAEAEPREVDPKHFPEGTRFASLFAGDSATFALTTSGLVYGWGTFRGNDGILGFSKDAKSKSVTNTQIIPTLLPELKQIKTMAVGANHAIALTHKGKTFIWGAGEQSELGRRVVARTATGALVPREFGLQKKNIVAIAAGEHCSFAVEKNGTVYSWGHNGYGQCGVDLKKNIDDVIRTPTEVEFLKEHDIAQIIGGNHHSLARTATGEVLMWGRLDNAEGGMKPEDMPEDSIITHPVTGRPLAAIKPLIIPNLEAEFLAASNDTSFVITPEGKAYSWGFSTNYQTGQGTDDEIVEATLVDNSAVRGKKLIFAGVGGQFGLLACEKDEA